MKPKTILWVAIAVLVVAVGFLVLRPSAGGIMNVDAAGAQKAIDAGVQVIDVRTAGEYQLGHLPKAINVPVDQIETQASSWDKEATYLVYCATGARSQVAVDLMKSMGFKNIKHFNAGVQAWSGQLEKGSSAGSATIETAGTPVFVEFFTSS